VHSGRIVPDPAKILARRKAMIGNLPKSGMAVVVLGGSHDLAPHLGNYAILVLVCGVQADGFDVHASNHGHFSITATVDSQ
jgi:hypothetical protein